MTYRREKCGPRRIHPLNWDTASVSWHLGNTPIILLLATGTSQRKWMLDNGNAGFFCWALGMNPCAIIRGHHMDDTQVQSNKMFWLHYLHRTLGWAGFLKGEPQQMPCVQWKCLSNRCVNIKAVLPDGCICCFASDTTKMFGSNNKDVWQQPASSTVQAGERGWNAMSPVGVVGPLQRLNCSYHWWVFCVDMFVLNFHWVWAPWAFWYSYGNILLN